MRYPLYCPEFTCKIYIHKMHECVLCAYQLVQMLLWMFSIKSSPQDVRFVVQPRSHYCFAILSSINPRSCDDY